MHVKVGEIVQCSDFQKKRELILKIPSERLLCPLPHSPPHLLCYNFLGVKAQRLPQSLGHQGVPIPLPTLLRTRLLPLLSSHK